EAAEREDERDALRVVRAVDRLRLVPLGAWRLDLVTFLAEDEPVRCENAQRWGSSRGAGAQRDRIARAQHPGFAFSDFSVRRNVLRANVGRGRLGHARFVKS